MSANAATRRSAGAESGFTLIEIMVVVVIIGLLTAIIAPRFFSQVEDAEASRVKADIRQIELALDLYRLDNYRYPSTEDGLEALISNPGESAAPNWDPRGYLGRRQVPVDPWGNQYQYLHPGQRAEFDVFSLGRDGEPGGEGPDTDIGNWDLN